MAHMGMQMPFVLNADVVSPEFANILLDVLCIFGQVDKLTLCRLLEPVSPQQLNLTQCPPLSLMPEAVKHFAVRHLMQPLKFLLWSCQLLPASESEICIYAATVDVLVFARKTQCRHMLEPWSTECATP